MTQSRIQTQSRINKRAFPALVLAIVLTTVYLLHSAAADDRDGTDVGTLSTRPFLLWVAVDTRFDALAGSLNLTESQRARITDLEAGIRREKGDALRRYSELLAQLRAAEGGQSGGPATATSGVQRELARLMSDLHPVLDGFENDVRALLNEAQAEALDGVFGRR